MREQWTFSSAGEVIFGLHAVERAGLAARRLGMRHALIVTDRVLVGVGLVDAVRKPLEQAGIAVSVFDGGEPEPSSEAVTRCLEIARAAGSDGLVALGGGSNIDVAKSAGVVLAHGGDLADYYGDHRIPGPSVPLIAIATTAGTGSEVTGNAVITDKARNIKTSIRSPYLRPQAAICDPLLTVSCPPKVTADAGIDALTHAVECLTGVDYRYLPPLGDQSPTYPGKNPLADMLALKAIELVGRHLRTAVYQGQNLEAREQMLLASMLAGMAFSNGALGAVHALEYAVAAFVPCSHGAGNGLLLPYVMEYNLPARPEAFATVARLLGEAVEGLSILDAAARSVAAVQRLKADIGIPMRLRDLGVQEADIPAMARITIGLEALMRLNPRPLTLQDAEGILRAAY